MKFFVVLVLASTVVSWGTPSYDMGVLDNINRDEMITADEGVAEIDKLSTETVYIEVENVRYNDLESIQYPVIKENKENTAAKLINETIDKLFLEDKEPRDGSVEGFEEYRTTFTANQIGTVLEVVKTEWCIPVDTLHGNYQVITYHFDLNTGEVLELEDLIINNPKGYYKITEEIKHMVKQMDNNEYIEQDQVDVNNGQAFRVSAKGLEIIYQPYDIAPFAMGTPSFVIPWERIESVIDKESSIWKGIWKE